MKVDTTTPTQPPSHWLAGVTLHTSLASHWWRGGTLDTWLTSHWSSHLHITPITHLPHLSKVVADVTIFFSEIDNGVTGRNARYIVWYCMVLYPYTASSRDVLGNTSPEEQEPSGNLSGIGVQNLKVQGECSFFYIKTIFIRFCLVCLSFIQFLKSMC